MAFAVTAAALAGAGASLVGSGLDYNARKKQAKTPRREPSRYPWHS